jgi:hypothetical protein
MINDVQVIDTRGTLKEALDRIPDDLGKALINEDPKDGLFLLALRLHCRVAPTENAHLHFGGPQGNITLEKATTMFKVVSYILTLAFMEREGCIIVEWPETFEAAAFGDIPITVTPKGLQRKQELEAMEAAERAQGL